MMRYARPVVTAICSLVLVVACYQACPRADRVSYTIQLEPGSTVDPKAVESALASLTHVERVLVEPAAAKVRLETGDRGRIDRAVIEAALRPIGLVVRGFEEPHAEFYILKVGGGG